MSVDTETSGHSRIVTLRWPEKKNSLAPEDARALTAELEAVGRDETARVLVLTGDGAFCSGGDLKSFGALSAQLSREEIRSHVYGDIQLVIRRLRDIAMPTIAAIDGPAIGLGMDLALACDQRFIGPNGWMLQGWARAGLISATAGSWFIEQSSPGALWPMLAEQPRLDGPACELLHLGECGSPTGLDSALHRAEQLADVPKDTLAAYIDLNRRQRWPSDEYLEVCADHQSGFIASERFRTLVSSLLSRNAGK